MTAPRRALVVTYGGGHANITIPVIRALRARAGWDVVALGATTAGPQLRAAGIALVGYRDLLSDDDAEARAAGQQLLGGSHDPSTGIPVEESVAYLGLCYQDLVERLGAEEAGRRYARHGRHAFLPLGPLRRAFDRWSPDVVVTTNSPKSERAALCVAKERGVPSLAVEDCLGTRQRFFPEFVPAFRADRICVCSRVAVSYLVEQGVPEAAIRCTGSPAFDGLASIGPDERERARAELGLGPRDRAVLFTAQAYSDLGRAEALLAAALAPIPRARALLRRHPSRRDGAGTEVDRAAIRPLLATAQVLVTVSSTTALEAVLLGTPVVQLGAELGVTEARLEHPDDLPLYRHGCALIARSAGELRDHLAAVLEGGRAEELRARARELFVRPGGAAARVADEIAALAA